MKTHRILLLFLLLALFTAADEPFVSENDHLTLAVLYHQRAPEYRALCYQSYNLAAVRLKQLVKRKGTAQGLAVVMDLDETVLDNSPFEAKCILNNSNYPVQWKEWCELARAEAVPGSVEFINSAKQLGVEVVYISNRKEEFRKVTRNNMTTLGIPEVRDEHLLLRVKESGKEARRQEVAKQFDIVLLIGDNLNDFSELFENAKGDDRISKTNDLKQEFGEKFIMLPNSMYGEWESDLYSEKNKNPQAQRAARYKALKSF